MAIGLLVLIVGLVYADRDAYTDSRDGVVSLIDTIYYATVTITTTGYGDITPIAPHSRVLNAVVVTPLRILFLVLLVGTTLEVLAHEGRRVLRDRRWRRHLRHHAVVVGYGTMGRSAVDTLVKNNTAAQDLVIIDQGADPAADANAHGFAVIRGDATNRSVLRGAEIARASQVIIALDRDAAAILVTLTVRQLNADVHVVVSVREEANAALLRQSGADAVVTSSESVGHLLGLSAISPNIGIVIEDLFSTHKGLSIAQRSITTEEVGRSTDEVQGEPVVGVVRDGTLRRFYDPAVTRLERGDEIVVIRRADEAEPP
jgi:voltage-gated potassium channel